MASSGGNKKLPIPVNDVSTTSESLDAFAHEQGPHLDLVDVANDFIFGSELYIGRTYLTQSSTPTIFCKNTYVTLICLPQITIKQIKYLLFFLFYITSDNLQHYPKSRFKMKEMAFQRL